MQTFKDGVRAERFHFGNYKLQNCGSSSDNPSAYGFSRAVVLAI